MTAKAIVMASATLLVLGCVGATEDVIGTVVSITDYNAGTGSCVVKIQAPGQQAPWQYNAYGQKICDNATALLGQLVVAHLAPDPRTTGLQELADIHAKSP